jgi:hypothetical protein
MKLTFYSAVEVEPTIPTLPFAVLTTFEALEAEKTVFSTINAVIQTFRMSPMVNFAATAELTLPAEIIPNAVELACSTLPSKFVAKERDTISETDSNAVVLTTTTRKYLPVVQTEELSTQS